MFLQGYIPVNLDRQQMTVTRKRNEYWQYVEQYFHTRYDEQYQDTFRQIHIDIPRMCPLVPLFQQKLVQEVLAVNASIQQHVLYRYLSAYCTYGQFDIQLVAMFKVSTTSSRRFLSSFSPNLCPTALKLVTMKFRRFLALVWKLLR